MEFHRWKTCIAIGLALWFTGHGFAQWDPDTTIPTSYIVTYSKMFYPSPTYDYRIKCNVTIGIHVKEDTKTIILARTLNVRKFNVTLNGTKCITSVTDVLPKLVVQLPGWDTKLKAGENYTMVIEFDADPRDVLIPSEDYANPMTGRKVNFAFGVDQIYNAFPCYKNYELRASVRMKICDVAEGYTVLRSAGTMPMKESTECGATPNTMPINKYGMVIGKFPKCKIESGKAHHCIHFHKDNVPFPQDDIRCHRTTVAMNRMLPHVANYLNTTLMPNKVDMIVLPKTYRGARNSWGLIYITENLLYTDSMMDEHRMYLEIAKLMVHQYFGVLVVPEPGKFTWLTEGIENFLAYKTVKDLYPTYDSLNQAHIESYHYAMQGDGAEDTVSMDENRSFVIDSHKAGSILRMLERVLGESALQQGLQNYFKFGQSRYMVPADLSLSLKAEEGNDFFNPTTVLAAWASKKGYPLVSITDINRTHITFKQERFSYLKESPKLGRPKAKPWPIPIWIPTCKETVWLTGENVTIEKPPKLELWQLAESARNGFYRMNYPEAVWDLMVKKLNSDHTKISPEARARLIDDSMQLARAGLVNYSIAWGMLKYLKKEKDFLPWGAAYEHFQFHLRRIFGQEEKIINLRKLIKEQVTPLFDKYQLNDADDASLSVKSLRNIAIDLAALSGYKDPLTWGTQPTYKVFGENVQETIGCNLVRALGDNTYNTLHNTLNLSDYFEFRFQRRFLLRVLTCSGDSKVLRSYVKSLFKDKSLTAARTYLPELFVRNSNPESLRKIMDRLTEMVSEPEEVTLNNNWMQFRKDRDFKRFVQLLRKFSTAGALSAAYDNLESLVSEVKVIKPEIKKINVKYNFTNNKFAYPW